MATLRAYPGRHKHSWYPGPVTLHMPKIWSQLLSPFAQLFTHSVQVGPVHPRRQSHVVPTGRPVHAILSHIAWHCADACTWEHIVSKKSFTKSVQSTPPTIDGNSDRLQSQSCLPTSAFLSAEYQPLLLFMSSKLTAHPISCAFDEHFEPA